MEPKMYKLTKTCWFQEEKKPA